MKFTTSFISLLLLVSSALAETHVYNWTAAWADFNPDGTYTRPVVACNGEFPWPTIRVNKGDRIVIYLNNGFDTEQTSLHFHGLFQNGTNLMDGVPGLTQCEISPGDTMIYNFTVADQVGSYWYHSHSSGQYMDGMRGALIIEDEDFPYDYDEEVVLTLSEWYHDPVSQLIPSFLNLYNPTGAEPIPQNLLWNDTRNGTWNVKPDTTYLMRIINIGGFVSQYLYMEDHTFEIVAVDGVYVEKNETDLIYITVAQRYDVLIHTKNTTDKNYAFMQGLDDDMLDTTPSELMINGTNYIVYDDSADMPDAITVDSYDDLFDDFYLQPIDNFKTEIYDDPEYTISVDVVMNNLNNGKNYAFFNNVSYVAPKVPTLGTVFSAGDDATNPTVYGSSTHPFVLQQDEVVEIILNNNDTGKHPFHLHGHIFQVIERGPDYGDETEPVPYNSSAPYTPPEYPAMRDVLYVRAQSYFRIRFKSTNPGIWFFHCHIEWHLLQGLAITLIEDPASIQSQQQLTDNWIDVCEGSNTPYIGNAANNTENYLDLTGENKQVASLPAGFTARGIVALVFSCVAGFLGIAMIGIYGMADIPNLEQRVFDDMSIESRELLGNSDEDELDDAEAKGVEGLQQTSDLTKGSGSGTNSNSVNSK